MLPAANDLIYFLEVAETLNMSQAAKRLGLSQPSLSAAMQRLEKAIGAPLLLRTRLGCHLTRSGAKLVPQARGLLEEWDRLRLSVDRDVKDLRGRFKLGCHTSVGLYSLHLFMADVLKKYPNLEFTVINDLSRRIVDRVQDFAIDFGIVVNPTRFPELVIRPLDKDIVTFWVGPKASPLNDVSGDDAVLIYDPNILQSQAILKVWNRRGTAFARKVECDSLELVAKLTSAGAGVGILPGRVVTNHPHLRLKLMKPDAPRFQDHICLVTRVETMKSKGAKELVNDIEKDLKKAWLH